MNDLLEYLEESIKIELGVASLYELFYRNLPEDRNFWWGLYMEELNHAALLKSSKNFLKLNILPSEMLLNDINVLKMNNKNIDMLIEYFKNNPSRNMAFKIAIDLESMAAEAHYNNFMIDSNDDDSTIYDVIRKLNNDDVKHLSRIKKYAEDNNIKIND